MPLDESTADAIRRLTQGALLVPHRQLMHTRSARTGRYHLATIRLTPLEGQGDPDPSTSSLTLELCPLTRQITLTAPDGCEAYLQLGETIEELLRLAVRKAREDDAEHDGGEAHGA